MKLGTSLVVLAACGGKTGSTTDATPPMADAMVFLDAPPNVSAMIKISGNTSEQGLSTSTPVAGVTIGIFKSSDEATPLATATTDALGNYSVMVETHHQPIVGYVKATKSPYVDSYVYEAGAITADLKVDVNMISQGNFNLLSTFAGGNQMAGKGVIALGVLDASSMPVVGATVSSTPASNPYRYDGSNGIPDSNATATNTDGYAYMFNVPGQVTISAAKAGAVFKSHPINAHADAFTTTVITQ